MYNKIHQMQNGGKSNLAFFMGIGTGKLLTKKDFG
jgi:hypothetical protein